MVTPRAVLTRNELDTALRVLVIELQSKFFVQLRHELTQHHRVSDKLLGRLCPFIVRTDVIRVRG